MTTLEKLQSGGCMPYIVGGGVVAASIIFLLVRRFRNKEPLFVDAPKDTLVLRQIPRGTFAPSLSPFPLKLETYLRMTNIAYKNVFGLRSSPQTAKTPWAQFNGEILHDSQLIIEHLNKYFKIDTMSHLSLAEKAVARAFLKMVEENTFWTLVRWRFMLDPDPIFITVFKLPRIVFWYFRRQVKKTLYGQGIGRLEPEVMYHIFEGDLKALSAYLGDKKFLMGEKACEVDCTVFGMLAQFKWQSPNSPLLSIMNSYPNLHAYCERMKEAFWPDWDECHTHDGTREATK